MKRIKRADLGNVTKADAFSRSVAKAKKDASKIIRASYTLEQRHIDQINKTAAELTRRQGKPINASQALRHLLDSTGEAAQ